MTGVLAQLQHAFLFQLPKDKLHASKNGDLLTFCRPSRECLQTCLGLSTLLHHRNQLVSDVFAKIEAFPGKPLDAEEHQKIPQRYGLTASCKSVNLTKETLPAVPTNPSYSALDFSTDSSECLLQSSAGSPSSRPMKFA